MPQSGAVVACIREAKSQRPFVRIELFHVSFPRIVLLTDQQPPLRCSRHALRTGPFDHEHEQHGTQAVIQAMIVALGLRSRHLTSIERPAPDDAFHRSRHGALKHWQQLCVMRINPYIEATPLPRDLYGPSLFSTARGLPRTCSSVSGGPMRCDDWTGSASGSVSYQIRILLYLDVSGVYLECILMCPVEIHQDTSRYICIWHLSSQSEHLYLLPTGMYPPFKIHLGYPPFKIHLGYIPDTNVSSFYISDT